MRIRTLISAAPAANMESMLTLHMERPDGAQANYLAKTENIPQNLECGAVYKIKTNGHGAITEMVMIEG